MLPSSRTSWLVALVLLTACASPQAQPGELDRLRADLESTETRTRSQALAGLAALGADAAPALADVGRRLDDESSAIRWAALWAISTIGGESESGIELLAAALGNDDTEVRRSAALALADHAAHAQAATAALERALDDPAPTVRVCAHLALYRIAPSPTHIDALVGYLGYGASNARENAALALARIGPEARVALPELRLLAADATQSSLVRGAAQAAIREIEEGDS